MEKKILVAYFSVSGITKEYAVTLALKLGADLYEIEPAQPYTEADLDWNDRNSRCVKEWKDKSCRPEIRTSVPDMSQYDTVFLGYPIWWESSPNIIYTFLESYNFSGKTLIPFSTSGGSIRGSAGTHLHKYTSATAIWKRGKLMRSGHDLQELAAWAARAAWI